MKPATTATPAHQNHWCWVKARGRASNWATCPLSWARGSSGWTPRSVTDTDRRLDQALGLDDEDGEQDDVGPSLVPRRQDVPAGELRQHADAESGQHGP